MPVVPATAENITHAAALLAAGDVVVLPTETVYGLAADATRDEALARIYATKNRPQFNPLIVHVASLQAAENIALFTPLAQKLAQHFWPGPLTLVLPLQPHASISPLATAGLQTVAVRVPQSPIFQAVLNEFGKPLAAPSANSSGQLSPTMAAHVAADLGDKVPLILDGGACPVGVESTIIDLTEPVPVLLRAGGVAKEDIEQVLGAPFTNNQQPITNNQQPKSPGLLLKHYAPRTPLRLNATHVEPHEALLAFGNPLGGMPVAMRNLSEKGDVIAAAANLFAHLHALDSAGATAIAVMPVPSAGLGEAINDRLRRGVS